VEIQLATLSRCFRIDVYAQPNLALETVDAEDDVDV